MKTKNILPITLLSGAILLGSILKAQSKETADNIKIETPAKTKSSPDEKAFMDRYYELKGAYPTTTSVYGNYAASKYTKEKFMERYNQIKAAYPKLMNVFGNYAGSKYALEDFIKRYYETKDTNPELAQYYGEYAASANTLPEFIKRYNQIKDSAADLSEVYGQYAASDNDLPTFSSYYFLRNFVLLYVTNHNVPNVVMIATKAS